MRPKALRGLRKVREYLETGKQIASSLEPFNHGITHRTIYDAGVRLAQIGIDQGLRRVFDWSNWKLLAGAPNMLHDEIIAVLKQHVDNPIETKEEKYFMGSLYGKQFLILRSRMGEEFIYIPIDGDHQEYKAFIGRALWEKYGSRMLMETIHEGEHKRTVKFSTDETEGFPSEEADKLYRRFKKFVDQGVNRSFMLYGLPGTGKTCLINYLVELFRGFSLTILPDETGYLRPSDLNAVLSLLQPNFLIINDLDRFFGTFLLLTEVERFNSQIKLLAATVNSVKGLSKALIRPGRFDEIIDIQTLGLGVVDELSAGWPAEIRELTKGWPVAFIEELRLRTEVLGLGSVVEEARRLEYRRQMNDEETEKEQASVEKKSDKKKLAGVKLIENVQANLKLEKGPDLKDTENAPDTSDPEV